MAKKFANEECSVAERVFVLGKGCKLLNEDKEALQIIFSKDEYAPITRLNKFGKFPG